MTSTIDPVASAQDDALTRRALRLALDKTTDMAERELRVPLHYYRDPKLTEIEESQILRRVPLAVIPSAQIANANDYVVRSVLGDSLLITRDRDGASHVLLNYCRHRGAMPACGAGNASRFTCPYHAWTYRNTGELLTVPGSGGFDSMDKTDYGLVELPSQERHGFIWAVLSADASIDVDAHLGDMGSELAQFNYASYGYHTEREFESDVSWKGALEAFAEAYHFPFVHGESVIGQNTLANTSIYDEFGKHHRMGFPFNWIVNLDADPSGAWDPAANMGLIYWIYPNLIWPTARSVWKSSTSCRPANPRGARSGTVGWVRFRRAPTRCGRLTTRCTRASTPRFAMRTSPCCPNADKACGTANTITWSSAATKSAYNT